jgi:hypothetical protein
LWPRRQDAAGYGRQDARRYKLGAVCEYASGTGVATDYIEALKWITLAADQGLGVAKEKLPLLDREMTPEQIAQAQQLAREFKPRKE